MALEAKGVIYRKAPTVWSTGDPKARKRVRKVWWRYELLENYTMNFADEYGIRMVKNPDYVEPSSLSSFRISATKLTAFKGFQWDGASGPTLQPKSSVRATLVHDVMCSAIHNEVLLKTSRANADLIFREILKDDGMSKQRRDIWYWMVDTFGDL